MQIKNFWNPFINPDNVVASSLDLGSTYGEQRSIIVTGANAGGKSTISKALVLSIILAQSLGIAPAEELTFTPFTKIITYLNITDDIAEGNSLFIAGVKRGRELSETIKNLNIEKNEYALSIADEMFGGTPPDVGQAAAYSLIKQIGKHPNNILVTTTHFPIIPSLEEETGLFTNYKVDVEINENGEIYYPYLLSKGTAEKVITFDILESEGFSDDFLLEAQRILEVNAKQ